MTIQYQNTRQDLRETLCLMARQQQRESRVGRVVVAVIMVVPFWAGSLLLNFSLPVFTGMAFAMNCLIAGVAIILILCAVNVANIIRLHAWRNLLAVLINLCLVGLIVVEWFAMKYLNKAFSDILPHPLWRALLPHIPWIAALVFILVLALYAQLRAQKMLWKQNPMLQRPKTAEIDANGIVIQDASARLEYQWAAFSKARETKNLFVLFFGPASYVMLPKRAFVMTDEMNAMRALMSFVAQPGAMGFSVATPGETPPPLPVAI
jgi:hypothetical protein